MEFTLALEFTFSSQLYHEILSNVQIYSDYITVCLSVHWWMFPKYVNSTADSLPVAKAEELADGASSDLYIISSVYNYIITHFTYDYSKASSVTSGYLPDTDEVFTAEKGICFDYAAVMTFLMIAFLMIAVILVLMQKSYLFFPKFMPNSEAS